MTKKMIEVDAEKWEKMKKKLMRNELTIIKFVDLIMGKVINDEKFVKELENEDE